RPALVVQRLELRRAPVEQLEHRLRNRYPAFPTLLPHLTQLDADALARALGPHGIELGSGVGDEPIERHHHRYADFLHVPNVAAEIGCTPLHGSGVSRT